MVILVRLHNRNLFAHAGEEVFVVRHRRAKVHEEVSKLGQQTGVGPNVFPAISNLAECNQWRVTDLRA
jgi:hypothetical protein